MTKQPCLVTLAEIVEHVTKKAKSSEGRFNFQWTPNQTELFLS